MEHVGTRPLINSSMTKLLEHTCSKNYADSNELSLMEPLEKTGEVLMLEKIQVNTDNIRACHHPYRLFCIQNSR